MISLFIALKYRRSNCLTMMGVHPFNKPRHTYAVLPRAISCETIALQICPPGGSAGGELVDVGGLLSEGSSSPREPQCW